MRCQSTSTKRATIPVHRDQSAAAAARSASPRNIFQRRCFAIKGNDDCTRACTPNNGRHAQHRRASGGAALMRIKESCRPRFRYGGRAGMLLTAAVNNEASLVFEPWSLACCRSREWRTSVSEQSARVDRGNQPIPRATCADDDGVCLRNGIGLEPFIVSQGFVRDFEIRPMTVLSCPSHYLIEQGRTMSTGSTLYGATQHIAAKESAMKAIVSIASLVLTLWAGTSLSAPEGASYDASPCRRRRFSHRRTTRCLSTSPPGSRSCARPRVGNSPVHPRRPNIARIRRAPSSRVTAPIIPNVEEARASGNGR